MINELMMNFASTSKTRNVAYSCLGPFLKTHTNRDKYTFLGLDVDANLPQCKDLRKLSSLVVKEVRRVPVSKRAALCWYRLFRDVIQPVRCLHRNGHLCV